MTDTCPRLEAIVREHSGLHESSISNETRLEDDLGLDSLDRIELAMRIEDEFGIEIPDGDVDRPALGTFGGLCAYVQGKLDVRRAA